MKKMIFTFLASFFVLSLVAQVDRENVLVEIGTGGWCTYCPGAAMGADELHENGDPVAIIEYHNGDPYATTESNARNNYYNISGYPTAWFDGSYASYVGGSHTQSMYSNYLPLVNARMEIQTDFVLEISGSVNGDEYNVYVNVEKVGDYSGTNLKLRFAVTESNIQYSWQGQSEFNFVCRDMVPDQNGTSVDFSNTDNVDVPLSFVFDNSWVAEECELIAFLQDDATKEVLHCAKVMLTELGEGGPTGFTAGFYADETEICFPGATKFHPACLNGDPISFNWYFEGGIPETSYAESPNVYYQEEGGYDVRLIVSNGSVIDTAFMDKYIAVINCVGIGEDEANSLEIFPNPNNGVFKINVNAEFNHAEISVLDAMGKEVYSKNGLNITESYSTSIDLSAQPQGIYFVVVKNDDQRLTKKVFVRK